MANANAKKAAGEDQVANASQPVKKVSRRGIGTARGTTRLKFSHEQAKNNGLFIGHLDNVDITTLTIGEDTTGMPSFNGLEIPRLNITFASNEEDANKRRYSVLQFSAVESNANTIPGGKEEWKINAILDWVKHLLNVYILKGRELTEEEEISLSLPFEDFDETGEYVPVEPEEVIAGWRVFFENFENIMNRSREDGPVYKTKDNKIIAIWMKLIRYAKSRKKGWTPVNNGELAFPTFVGEGCIEIFKQNTPPSIRLNSISEAIIPMNIEKAKAPNAGSPGGVYGGPGMGGVPVGDPMGGGFGSEDLNNQAADDMPF